MGAFQRHPSRRRWSRDSDPPSPPTFFSYGNFLEAETSALVFIERRIGRPFEQHFCFRIRKYSVLLEDCGTLACLKMHRILKATGFRILCIFKHGKIPSISSSSYFFALASNGALIFETNANFLMIKTYLTSPDICLKTT